MARLCLLLLFLTFGWGGLTVDAQKKTTVTKKTVKVAPAKKKISKTTSAKAKTQQKQPVKSKKIQALEAEKKEAKRQLDRSERELTQTKKNVTLQLRTIDLLDGQLESRKKLINELEAEVRTIDRQVRVLQKKVTAVEMDLRDAKERYVSALRYAQLHKTEQSPLLFVFSGKTLTQMYRRSRYVADYAMFQRNQGEQIKKKQAELLKRQSDLLKAKSEKNKLMTETLHQREQLEVQSQRQRDLVAGLKKKEKGLISQVKARKQQVADLDKRIDEAIAYEIEQARIRAEKERKAAEERRRKAAKANARKLAEAKEVERRALEAEKKAKTEAEREKARQNTEKARANIKVVERKAADDARVAATPVASSSKGKWHETEDKKLSGSFERNKGRLPVPLTGRYMIGGKFGSYNVPGHKGVRLDNKGTNYIGQRGAKARAIFDGVVTAVFQFGDTKNVLVRHGSYISVYCNLSTVSVHRNQQVRARQNIGSIADDGAGNCILHFQLRKEKSKLNPELWIAR